MSEVIIIDGSYGEGGGQILRSSIALSALTLKPVKVINIRAKRPNPGLRPQHLTAIKAVATLTDAHVEGLSVGSRTIVFVPKTRRSGNFKFNIGTAGSISLVLQAILPLTAFSPGKCSFEIIGGTDVMKAPPIDYVKNVLLPWLRKMGFHVEIEVRRRGHYPRGGGIVRVTTNPVKRLKPIIALERGEIVEVRGISHAVRLPKHVAERQARSAIEVLKAHGIENIHVDIEWYERGKDPHLGPGSGIVLWAITDKGSILGADALGERGKRAEIVGKEAAMKLLEELKSNAPVDSHMGDMLIPFMAVADGTSKIKVSKLTMHTITNIHVAERIVNVKFKVEGSLGNPAVISVKGLALITS